MMMDGYYQLRIQKILEYSNLPGNLKGLPRQHCSITGKFDEFMIPFISEIKELEKGKVMTVQRQDAWIIAGLNIIMADLPQGNDMTGVLRHNANKGCHTYEEILKISNKTIMSRRDQLCTEYGLRSLPSILDKLKRERHLQTPQDVYHATAKKIGHLLKLTCKLFSRKEEDNFIDIWKNFEIPKRWSSLSNLITHYNNFMISIPKIIISCWIYVAKTMKAVFNKKFTLDSYEELQQCLEEEFSIITKVFVNFVNLPNIHINIYASFDTC
ncbi:hypothetical protein GLOIN_2v1874285 [Rhizophagus irregularis DAOM 181602=DAOM 197198]|uniref:Uncharacterized protein n=1 Tax=Rhizophagus irregularis (strain DAOM 181602 / DAOM 197198 / MUCL 43194) TaxID=747089 RepID=A0A2P4Q766_RHIID|nr:hypothetical protein GLOIN_2v1874285 [Rhizophagus irregularis DAOM 181602=DAOM 197198]POG73485.1 hypothetical protein GLOIN_2v1874285 [Rhizophagus irregularis DAOM 181602=DAOM 197198]|eukprot:XP_025180351.1 hypothetical protein GLOIN_2v1874285 [Rhizophagus irregularis DAOM 181602=DAOM 197198]